MAFAIDDDLIIAEHIALMSVKAARAGTGRLQRAPVKGTKPRREGVDVIRFAIRYLIKPHKGVLGAAARPIRPGKRRIPQRFARFGCEIDAMAKHFAGNDRVGGLENQTGIENRPPVFIPTAMPEQFCGDAALRYAIIESRLCAKVLNAPRAAKLPGAGTKRGLDPKNISLMGAAALPSRLEERNCTLTARSSREAFHVPSRP